MAVRWDAAVGGSRFWSEPERGAAGAAGAPLAAQVWLFGRLARAAEKQPLSLALPNPFCVRDVIAELRRRCDAEALAPLTAASAGRLRDCRVFVDGLPVEDAGAPIEPRASPARVEIILLTAIEGG